MIFVQAIQERQLAGEIHDMTIHDFISVDLREAVVKQHVAYITVQFVTQQSHIIRDKPRSSSWR